MGRTIEAVKDFVYLGSNQGTNSGKELEIRRGILQANRMYLSLLPVTRSRAVHRQTEKRLYEALIRPVLWYASESQTVAKNSESALGASEDNIRQMQESKAWGIM
jgi:hypothetical protein